MIMISAALITSWVKRPAYKDCYSDYWPRWWRSDWAKVSTWFDIQPAYLWLSPSRSPRGFANHSWNTSSSVFCSKRRPLLVGYWLYKRHFTWQLLISDCMLQKRNESWILSVSFDIFCDEFRFGWMFDVEEKLLYSKVIVHHYNRLYSWLII